MKMRFKPQWLLALTLLLLLVGAYSNHFDNGFYFDDTHTIVNNTYIRDITLLPHYFTDIKYYGTMLGNQGYNPILVALNAIDYWIAGELNPVVYHKSIFFSYVVLLVALFFVVRKLYQTAFPDINLNLSLWTVVTVGFYGLHAANAETINYIIMRSDSFSTLCMLIAFLAYMWPMGRKYLLYLLPMLLGIGTKETGVMFGPLLFIYIFLFEENLSLTDLIKKDKWKSIYFAIVKSLPATLIGFGSYFLIRNIFIPETHLLFPEASGSSTGVFHYFVTQWFVLAHYLGNFILPLDLSADPDFVVVNSILNRKVLLSLGLLLGLVAIAVQTSRIKKYRPISFGILWFFIALAPTSSFHPLGQVANDHRTFFPYIGLVISLGWYLILLIQRFKAQLTKPVKYALISLGGLVLCLHAYGTYQRNEVWGTAEKLWYDVTEKSPNNARGLMNYGITQMSKGEYERALLYFERALVLEPRYSYLCINLGILHNALGNKVKAENYFKDALRYAPNNAEAYLYYGNWLFENYRLEEAKTQLNEGLRVSPGHLKINQLIARFDSQTENSDSNPVTLLEQAVEKEPNEANYINLSVAYYQIGNYEGCVMACLKAIEFNPLSADAFNNLCSGYIKLNEPRKAIDACTRALAIRPEFPLATNNLRWAKSLAND
jgi:tetratricopeptide (TPR) repeat protein